MILCEYVSENKEAFCAKVESVAANLGIDPNWLMAVMYVESLISPNAVNPATNATGLIQFMPNTAVSLGTTTDELLNMTNVEQLDYVEKYLKPYASKIKSYIDTYLTVFFPAAVGKPSDWVLQAPGLSAEIIAKQNRGIDFDQNKKLTVGEVERWALSPFPQNIKEILKKKE